jgi:hypothetical protein
MAKYLLILLACWAAAAWALVNATYAIRSPGKYLRSPWTIRRGLHPECSSLEVRVIGTFLLFLGAFFLWVACMATLGLVLEPDDFISQLWGPDWSRAVSSPAHRYIFFSFWWFWTLSCLLSGIFQLAPLPGWISSRWGTTRTPGRDHPGHRRLMGAIMTIVGAFFAYLGVRIATGNLPPRF